MPRIWGAVIIFLLAGLTACTPSKGNGPAAAGAQNRDAAGMLAAAVNARRGAECILASGDMKIFDRGSDFSLGVQIENFAAVYPGKMRMKTTKLAGSVDVFDALMRDGNIAFYVPRHKTLYTGKVNELQSGGLNFSPDLIVTRLLKGDRQLLDFQWKVISTPDTRRKNAFTEIEQVHRPGENYLRVQLDARRPLINKISYVNGRNVVYLVEEYANYRDGGDGRNPEVQSFFPARFNLLWPDKDRYVKINLKRFDLNRRPEELAEAFSGIDDLDLDKVKRKALGQARVESDPQSLASVEER